MNGRCTNERNKFFHNYGGRGITVCDRWRDSFENFLADMGPRPSEQHSIDRIDNNGNYEPGNCRWATKKQQLHNLRRNHFMTFNGETLVMAEWARRIGATPQGIIARLNNGWSDERALGTPFGNRADRAEIARETRGALRVEWDGKSLTLGQWERVVGISRGTIRDRLRSGWPVELALTTPPRST